MKILILKTPLDTNEAFIGIKFNLDKYLEKGLTDIWFISKLKIF